MRKRVGIIKRVLCLSLIFLLSINSFAAIVSDNDGSAFITKAEFDALKSNFQAQIDSYNQSIDSKIDGAIASYLSGIKLSSFEDVSTICYDPEGIYGVVADDANLKWAEGTLAWSNRCIIAQAKGTEGSNWFWVKMAPLDAEAFTKCAINRTSKTNTVAEWLGLYTQKDSLTTVCDMTYTAQFSNGPSPISSKPLVLAWNVSNSSGFENVIQSNTGWNEQSNVWDMWPKADMLSLTVKTDRQFNARPQYTGWPWQAVSAGVSHETLNIIYKNILCCVPSISFYRFSNLYNDCDWCNDTISTDGHTRMANLGECFASASWKGGWKNASNGAHTDEFDGPVNFWPDSYYDETQYAAWSTIYKNKKSKPYLGFDTKVKDYKNLYTTAYDKYCEDMATCGATSDAFLADLGANHLKINVGVPIAKVKGPCKVELPIKFKNTTANYDVWVSLKPFTSTKEPWSDTVVFDRAKIYTGGFNSSTVATVGSKAKSIKVVNQNKFYFDVPDGEHYIYLKWYPAVTSTDGGTFLPEQSITTQKYN